MYIKILIIQHVSIFRKQLRDEQLKNYYKREDQVVACISSLLRWVVASVSELRVLVKA
jgi:hypothetical protein